MIVVARAAIEIEFLVASNSRHRNALAASPKVGTFHTRQSKTGNRSAYSGGRNPGKRRLKRTAHSRREHGGHLLHARPSKKI